MLRQLNIIDGKLVENHNGSGAVCVYIAPDEAERKFLAGAGAQYESEMVYHKVREDLEKLGVIFLSMDDGLKQHPELVKEYFIRGKDRYRENKSEEYY